MTDNDYLRLAIGKAKESVTQGGFPAGAVLVHDGQVVSEGISIGNILHDPTSHGEVASIRAACKKSGSTDLSGATLYASMQPCVMCLGAAMWSSVSRIVFACAKQKVDDAYYGGRYDQSEINATFSRPIEIVHVAELEEESVSVVREWEKSL